MGLIQGRGMQMMFFPPPYYICYTPIPELLPIYAQLKEFDIVAFFGQPSFIIAGSSKLACLSI